MADHEAYSDAPDDVLLEMTMRIRRASTHAATCPTCREAAERRQQQAQCTTSDVVDLAPVKPTPRHHPQEWYPSAPDYRPEHRATPGRDPDAFDRMPIASSWKTFEANLAETIAHRLGGLRGPWPEGEAWFMSHEAGAVVRVWSPDQRRWVLARIRVDVLDGVL